jgi:glycine/D-amino acid oxidase-like deaminating enzyme
MDDNSTDTAGHVSFWEQSVQMPETPVLDSDLQTDVLIVGGGIAGLTTAYFLLKSGRQIVLVEDGQLASGESGRTTAHLTAALDDRYYTLEKTFGEKKAALAAESHTVAVSTIEHIVETERIDCDFKRVDGYLFLHPSDKPEHLHDEYEATSRVGLGTRLQHHIPGMAGGENRPCIVFPDQAQFHITKYLAGLTGRIISMGGKIYTGTHASEITAKGAKANGFAITADHIVVATDTPVNDIVTMHTKQHAYRTYVIGCKIRKGSLPYSLWWDTGEGNGPEAYHYVRLQPYDSQSDLLICGGEDHKTGQAGSEPEAARYARLESWARANFPQITEIAYKWSGQVMEPVDGLGFMGKNPGDKNVYIITGDSGNGMTHTTIGGMIVRDLIVGVPNRWANLYDPARITLAEADTFLGEASNMAVQYFDWVRPSEIDDVSQIEPGHGGIVTSGLRKVAVYRDPAGMVHRFSAVCPHLGGIVRWNDDEKSFDCPVHGSRFTCMGAVVNGPANIGLKAE